MIKRNNDGYVLAYVMVVIAVIGLISASLMTSTMNVMQAQQASIQHMKDKYEAQGEIERLVAELEHTLKSSTSSEGIIQFSSPIFETSDTAREEVESTLTDLLLPAEQISLNLPLDPYTTHETTCTFSYISQSSGVCVTSGMSMVYEVTIISHDEYNTEDPDHPIYVDTDYSYTLIIKSLDIISYEISSKEVSSDPSEEDAA